jgi:hypothetical protein
MKTSECVLNLLEGLLREYVASDKVTELEKGAECADDIYRNMALNCGQVYLHKGF